MQKNETAKFVRCREAAELLGLAEGTIRRCVSRGEIPGIRVGSNILVSRAALMRLIAQATGEPDRPAAA